jgi:hypothetical protein
VTVTATVLGSGQLAAGSAAIMMPPATALTSLTSVAFSNTNTAVEVIAVYLVRSGGAPGSANLIIPGQTLAPNQTYVAPELKGRTLNAGDALFGFSTHGSVVNFVIDAAVYS